MGHQTITSRSERAAGLTITVAVHLALFALLISIGAAHPLVAPREGSMSLIAIAIAPETALGKPPPRSLPSKVPDIKRITSQDPFSVELDPTPLGAAGGCATLDLIGKSLNAEPAVTEAALKTPRESRSIADAVVIWNAGWSDTAGSASEPLGPARIVIQQSLRSVPDQCLDEPVAGPRLVPIPDGDRTMFLAIGSGNWTWRQLIFEPDPARSMGARQKDQVVSSYWNWF